MLAIYAAALAPSTMARLVAAVPKGFAMSSDDVRYVNEFIDTLFPMSPEGYNFDLFVSNADVTNYNLEGISVPTLIAHTKDDQLASHEASQPHRRLAVQSHRVSSR
jgi:hypothetical protein